MRIAVLTNAYPPDAHGGAGQIAWLQVEGLRAQGHEVHVWHVPLVWTHAPLLGRLVHHLFDLVYVHACAKAIVAWKPDRLLTHNLTGIGFRTPRFVQRQGISWVHVLHDGQLFQPSGQLRAWYPVTFWQRSWAILRRLAMGVPDHVISPTQTLLRAHKERGFFLATPTSVIPNPAPALVSYTRIRHTPLRVVFVGRWSEDKGSLCIEKLWSAPALSKIEWHLIGPGTERTHPPHGKGHGPLTVTEILTLFADMDLLLVPSQIMENQPTIVLEAMSQGLPVIAARQDGTVETLGPAGTVCDAGDTAGWKQEIITCVEEDDRAYDARVRQMRSAWSRYDPAVAIQRVDAVLVTLN